MTDYEQRVKAIETLGEIRAKYNFWDDKERPYYEALSEAIRVLNAQNDKSHYAKIVRCEDCKHWERDVIFSDGWCRGKHQGNPDWFCADGERREE